MKRDVVGYMDGCCENVGEDVNMDSNCLLWVERMLLCLLLAILGYQVTSFKHSDYTILQTDISQPLNEEVLGDVADCMRLLNVDSGWLV